MKRVLTCALSLVLASLMSFGASGLNARRSVAVPITTPAPGAASEESGEAEVVPADYDPNISMMVRYDYDDQVRVGVVSPAFVEIDNKGPAVEGTLRLSITPQGMEEAYLYEMPVHVEQGAKTTFTLPFHNASDTQNIQIHLIRNGETVAEAKRARALLTLSKRMLVGFLGDNLEGIGYRGAVNYLTDGEAATINVTPVDLSPDEFPEQFFMLDRFALLVFHHFDLGNLNEAQQGALIRWVNGGGRLLVDGDTGNQQAIQSLRPLIELQVEGALSSEDPAALLSAMTGENYPEGAKLERLGRIAPAGGVIAGSEASPLIMEYPVGEGKVLVTAFALNDPFFQTADAPNMLRKIRGLSAWSSTDLDAAYGGYGSYGGSTVEMLGEAVKSIPWLDAPSIGWILLILLAFIVLAAPVSYILLAKRDKRDWIWVTAPALALAFCGVIMGYGVGRHGTQTVTSVVTVIDSRGGAPSSQCYSLVGIAAPRQGRYELRLEEDAFPTKQPNTDRYRYRSYDSSDPKPGKPTVLFDVNGYPKVTFEEMGQWSMDTFTLQRDLPLEGGLLAQIQYGVDGTSYTVRNDTGTDLEDVTIVCLMGYCRIPVVPSGEQVTGKVEPFGYMQNQAAQAAAASSSYYSYAGTSLDYWQILNEFYNGPEGAYYGTGEVPSDTRSEDEQREDYRKSRVISALIETASVRSYSSSSASVTGVRDESFIWGWSRELGALAMTSNGKPVRNDLNQTIVIGRVQTAYISGGELSIPFGQIVGVITDSQNIANGTVIAGQNNAYFDAGEVTFAFQIPEEAMEYNIETLSVAATYAYGSFTCLLYNNRTGQWDECVFEEEFTGSAARDYINASGEALLKITSDVPDGEEQGDFSGEISIDYPTIHIAGKEK